LVTSSEFLKSYLTTPRCSIRAPPFDAMIETLRMKKRRGRLRQEALDVFDHYYSENEFCLDPDDAMLARIDAQVEAAFAEVSPE
jgi:hypothetical protein